MIECETIPLKELCDIRIGRTPRRDTPKYWGGENVWVTVKELNNEIITDSKEHITDIAVNEVMSDPIPAGTILVSFKLSIGKMAVAGRPLFKNEAIAALVIRDEKLLNRDYLSYALSRVIHGAETSHAVNGKLLNKSKLEKLLIPVVPIEEQRRIVDILKRADSIRRLRKQAIDTARQLIPALFIDMFGDPATNPKEWPFVDLGDLITCGPQNGLYKPASCYGEGVPILRIDGFYDGVVTDYENLRRLNVTKEELEKYRLNQNDIVINRVNSPDYLGKSALIQGAPEETVFESNMMRFAVDGARIEPRYLIFHLQLSAIKNQILAKAKHAIKQSSINQRDVKSLRLILPPMELQEEFVNRVSEIRSILAEQDNSLRKAEMIFRSFLNTLFQVGPADWSSSSGLESSRSTTSA